MNILHGIFYIYIYNLLKILMRNFNSTYIIDNVIENIDIFVVDVVIVDIYLCIYRVIRNSTTTTSANEDIDIFTLSII